MNNNCKINVTLVKGKKINLQTPARTIGNDTTNNTVIIKFTIIKKIKFTISLSLKKIFAGI